MVLSSILKSIVISPQAGNGEVLPGETRRGQLPLTAPSAATAPGETRPGHTGGRGIGRKGGLGHRWERTLVRPPRKSVGFLKKMKARPRAQQAHSWASTRRQRNRRLDASAAPTCSRQRVHSGKDRTMLEAPTGGRMDQKTRRSHRRTFRHWRQRRKALHMGRQIPRGPVSGWDLNPSDSLK